MKPSRPDVGAIDEQFSAARLFLMALAVHRRRPTLRGFSRDFGMVGTLSDVVVPGEFPMPGK